MQATTKNPALTRGALLDTALACAMRWRWSYAGYETRQQAIRALARRSEGFTERQLENALVRGRQLWDAAERSMEAAKQAPWARKWDAETDQRVAEIGRGLAAEHPGFWKGSCVEAAQWAHYWIILR